MVVMLGGEYQNILEEIILNCKSFRSIADTMRGLGLTYSPQQLEIFLTNLFEESKRFNARQLDADFAFIYIDAKVIDLVDESGAIKKAVHFTVLGVNMECKKELLLSVSFFGSESLDLWKKVIMNLKNRGLTRVLMLITDDFSGLNKIVGSLLPNCDHQLCLVHLMRNLKKNLSEKLYEDFGQLLQEIYLCGSFEAASIKLNAFIENNIKPESSSYAKYLKERLENYLAFTKHPSQLRPVIRSTNAVEGINNAIEIARRNSGGYFHSERELAVKMKIIFDNLATGKWRNPIPRYAANLAQINQIFCERFEG
jgi:putative transposase